MSETFSIQFVSQITGINGHTIRAWEKRYSAVVPKRDKNKRRLYTQEDIDRLTKIQNLCSLGNSVSDIASLNDADLSKLHEKFFDKVQEVQNKENENDKYEEIDINVTLQNLMLAINHYKLDVISHELEKAKNSLSAREFALNLLIPLLVEIGMHVNSGFITVGMEQAITAIVRFHLGQMIFKEYQRKNHVDFHVLLATPEAEFNDFSIMIATLLCAHYKLKFTYLGVNMTPYILADAAKHIKSNLTILSVSKNYIIDPKRDLHKFLSQLEDKSDFKSKIFVTGVNQPQGIDKSLSLVDYIPTLRLLDRRLSEII